MWICPKMHQGIPEKEDDGQEEAEEKTREVEEEEGYWAAASPAPPLSLQCCMRQNSTRPAALQ